MWLDILIRSIAVSGALVIVLNLIVTFWFDLQSSFYGHFLAIMWTNASLFWTLYIYMVEWSRTKPAYTYRKKNDTGISTDQVAIRSLFIRRRFSVDRLTVVLEERERSNESGSHGSKETKTLTPKAAGARRMTGDFENEDEATTVEDDNSEQPPPQQQQQQQKEPAGFRLDHSFA